MSERIRSSLFALFHPFHSFIIVIGFIESLLLSKFVAGIQCDQQRQQLLL